MAARDRLAGARAQQGGGNQAYGDTSYPPQQANYGDGGRGYVSPQQSYGSPNVNSSRYPQQQPSSNAYGMNPRGGSGAPGDMSAFYDEIKSIQEDIRHFNDSVHNIDSLHGQSLNNMDEVATQKIEADLDNLVQETRALSGAIKARIQRLSVQDFNGRDGQIRQQQTELVKSKFTEAVQNYQDIEKAYRAKYKQRMERQYRIVKPDATPEEVRAVVNDEQGGQIFAQALMNSNRYGVAKAAYQEVQERHRDIQKIERTIVELGQLFQDMSNMVLEQDDTLKVIEHQAQNVNTDTEQGLKHTTAAVQSAIGARKKRWICFWICVVILIIVGVAVGVEVSQHVNNNKKTS